MMLMFVCIQILALRVAGWRGLFIAAPFVCLGHWLAGDKDLTRGQFLWLGLAETLALAATLLVIRKKKEEKDY